MYFLLIQLFSTLYLTVYDNANIPVSTKIVLTGIFVQLIRKSRSQCTNYYKVLDRVCQVYELPATYARYHSLRGGSLRGILVEKFS